MKMLVKKILSAGLLVSCFSLGFHGPVSAQSVSADCNEQVAIYLAPTADSWKAATGKIANDSKLVSAVKANKGWGATKTPAIPVHLTLTSYAAPSNSSCKSPKHGSATRSTVNTLNKIIQANGSSSYHLNSASWSNPKATGNLTLFYVQGSHPILDDILKVLKEGRFYEKNGALSVSKLHVSFVKNSIFDANANKMKDFLGELRWTALKMCAEENSKLEITARSCN